MNAKRVKSRRGARLRCRGKAISGGARSDVRFQLHTIARVQQSNGADRDRGFLHPIVNGIGANAVSAQGIEDSRSARSNAANDYLKLNVPSQVVDAGIRWGEGRAGQRPSFVDDRHTKVTGGYTKRKGATLNVALQMQA